MNLINRSFIDKRTKQIVVVKQSNDNLVILDNGKKIAVERLLDKNFFAPQLPTESHNVNESHINASFQDNTPPLDSVSSLRHAILGQVKNMDTSNMTDVPDSQSNGTSIRIINPVMTHEPHTTIVEESDEDDLLKKYSADIAHNQMNTQTEAFKDILGDDADIETNMPIKPASPSTPRNTPTPTTPKPTPPTERTEEVVNNHQQVENPIYLMFRGAKKSKKLTLNIKIDEKIPDKDFLKLFEESYEISIIDFFTDEFYNKLMGDPNIIKDQIRKAIKDFVYPPKRRKPNTKK